MRPSRKLGAVLVAVLTISLLTATPGTAGSNTAQRSGTHQTQSRSVTLITGDRITWYGDGRISAEPREGARFLTYSHKGHHYVIPSDALPLLRDDRIDRRLFNITALLDAGYDKRASLPLLITGSAQSRAAAPAGLKVTRSLPVVNGYAATGTPDQLRGYWKGLTGSTSAKASPGKVWLDAMRQRSLDVSVPQIGAPAAWNAGLDGTGVKVAVLDTGVDATHPDLAGKISAAQNFAAEEEDALDRVGHGTHVASTIAGSGATSGGKYKGVAPGATLLDGKVCVTFGCAESWILAGMQWAAESGADVVNMSLGGGDGPEVDPLEQAVNDLTAQHGTLFVIAAGNSGFGGDYTVGSPASADAALAVGAVDKTDKLAEFSSRGPRIGDSGLKPEITGPGVAIVAARSKDGFLGTPGQPYMSISGTSMATPHVAGAAAILSQQHPQWTAAQRKAALTGSANPNATDGPFAQGAGRVDVARAITAQVSSSPAALSFGVQTWPHEDDPVVTKAISYHNAGAADVTLQLALSDNAGGAFSLSASSVTVPAGGSASVNLTADTRQGNLIGPLGGRVVATADGVRVQTPFGVDREEQKFRVELVHKDRTGAPAESHFTVAFNLETRKDYLVSDPDGTGEIRVPAGTYFLFSWIDTFGEGEPSTTQLMWPKLQVGADQTIQLDARLAGVVNVTLPDTTVTPLLINATGTLEFENGSIGAGVVARSFDGIFTGHLGPKPVQGFSASVQTIFGREQQEMLDPTILYSLAWTQTGSFYQGFTKQLAQRDLATIKEDYARHATEQGVLVRFPNLPGGAWAVGSPTPLPGERAFYVNDTVAYDGFFEEFWPTQEGRPETVTSVGLPAKKYEVGKTVREHFNRAVFGPTFPESRWPSDWISRVNDEIGVFPPLFGDSEGRAGFGKFTSARTALYRNGSLVGEKPLPYAVFEVPAAAAQYRVESTVERGAPARLSTKVHTVWGFNSAHVDGVKRLPVTAMGFSPQLDRHNSARARGYMVIPVKVWQQPGSDAKRLKSLKVQVSHDDGATWKEAIVISVLGQRFVLLANPAQAGFVSLRAQAEDVAGNTVDQTIIRAYEVK
ncbi:MAG TPA: peptidase S8 [Micromonosporaceae bacterium]|nr:peptidase S8 [Micromonosporaceae bacterium]